jgi:hypothetical protein
VASLARVRTIVLHEKFLSIISLRIPMQNPTYAKALFLHALKCKYRKNKKNRVVFVDPNLGGF